MRTADSAARDVIHRVSEIYRCDRCFDTAGNDWKDLRRLERRVAEGIAQDRHALLEKVAEHIESTLDPAAPYFAALVRGMKEEP